MKKKPLFLAMLFIIVATVVAFYWYQKPRASLSNVKADYTISAKELYAAFLLDESKANHEYVDKVLQVSGIAESVQVTDTTINLLLAGEEGGGGVSCSVRKEEENQPVPVKGAGIRVKGRCTGFLMDVNLVDAIIVNQ